MAGVSATQGSLLNDAPISKCTNTLNSTLTVAASNTVDHPHLLLIQQLNEKVDEVTKQLTQIIECYD